MGHNLPCQQATWPIMAIHSGAVVSRGERIRRERNLRGWDQAHLAEMTGVSVRTLGRIESGQSEKSRHIPKLEQFLGINGAAVDAVTEPQTSQVTLGQATRLELLTELLGREIAEQRAGGHVIDLPRDRFAWPREDLPSGRQADEGDGEASHRQR